MFCSWFVHFYLMAYKALLVNIIIKWYHIFLLMWISLSPFFQSSDVCPQLAESRISRKHLCGNSGLHGWAWHHCWNHGDESSNQKQTTNIHICDPHKGKQIPGFWKNYGNIEIQTVVPKSQSFMLKIVVQLSKPYWVSEFKVIFVISTWKRDMINVHVADQPITDLLWVQEMTEKSLHVSMHMIYKDNIGHKTIIYPFLISFPYVCWVGPATHTFYLVILRSPLKTFVRIPKWSIMWTCKPISLDVSHWKKWS